MSVILPRKKMAAVHFYTTIPCEPYTGKPCFCKVSAFPIEILHIVLGLKLLELLCTFLWSLLKRMINKKD